MLEGSAAFVGWSQVKASDFDLLSLPKPERFFLAVGTLDDDPAVRPAMHIFTASKAPWDEITDGLPRHDAYP